MKRWPESAWFVVGALVLAQVGCTTSKQSSKSRFDNGFLANSSYPGMRVGSNAVKPREDASLVSRIGESFQSMGDSLSRSTTKEAIDPVSLTAESNPSKPDLYLTAAQFNMGQKNYEAAGELYGRALDAEPDNVAALLGLGRVTMQLGNFDEALKLYLKSEKQHTKNPAFHNDLGLCYERLGQPEKSIASFRKAFRLDSNNDLYRNNLAMALAKNEELDEAIALLAEAREQSIAQYNIGQLLYSHGDLQRSMEHFDLALEANPNFSAAKTMRDRVGVQLAQNVVAPPAVQQGRVEVASHEIRLEQPRSLQREADQDSPARLGPIKSLEPDGQTPASVPIPLSLIRPTSYLNATRYSQGGHDDQVTAAVATEPIVDKSTGHDSVSTHVIPIPAQLDIPAGDATLLERPSSAGDSCPAECACPTTDASTSQCEATSNETVASESTDVRVD